MKLKATLDHFFFQDVVNLMAATKKKQLTLADCETITTVNEQIEQKDDWPDFPEALKKLRQSPLRAITRWERSSLQYMFVIHLISVLLAVFGSLIAVKILKTFSATNLDQTNAMLTAAGLAILVLTLNVSAAVLHSQKIEREVLLLWRVRARLVPNLFRVVTGISRSGRYQYKTGDILNVSQTDSTTIASFIAHCLVDIPVLIISLFIIMFALYSFLGSAAWIPLVVILIQIPLSAIFSWATSLLFKEYMNRSDRRISLITEFIQGMRLVRYFGWGKVFSKDIDKTLRSQFRQEIKISAGFCIAFAQSSSWWMVVSLGVCGGLLYFQQGLSADKVFGGMWLSSILNNQLTPLPWFVSSFASARVAAKRIKRFVRKPQQEELIHAASDRDIAPNIDEAINIGYRLKGVSYQFEDAHSPVLKDLTFDILPGSTTAIVGPVGSGKSVLLQLLLGELQPTTGTIDLLFADRDGEIRQTQNIQSLSTARGLEILRQSLAWVPQEAFVVSASVRENVPLSYQDQWEGWSDNEIMHALAESQMATDLATIPGQLDASLGERGINLSGGQKQRLNLARGQLDNKKLLLLDDPFSAIDKDTENLIAPTLFNRKGQTLLWVTHRYHHLRKVDRILYLAEGRAKDFGKSDQLIQQHGPLKDFLVRTGHEEDIL